MTAPTIDTTTSVVREDDIPFALFWEGIEVKLLRIAADGSSYTILSRFAPGTELPRHKHFGPVHAYTLSGRWRYKEYDWVAEPGSFIYEPSGSTHTLLVDSTESEPALIYFTVEGGMVLLDENDEPFMVEDAPTMAERYADCLANQGIQYPTGVLS